MSQTLFYLLNLHQIKPYPSNQLRYKTKQNTIALIGLVLITGPVWKSNPTFEKKHLPIYSQLHFLIIVKTFVIEMKLMFVVHSPYQNKNFILY